MIQRKKRQQNNIPVVSLIGYTNTGKSTIMYMMLDSFRNDKDKSVLEKDMLFSTLETAVRRVTLNTNQTFLLTDTVGFIHKLPHHLVKAFRSTLEEVLTADVLIHVVNYANPHHEAHRKLTNQIVAEIGARDIPIIYAYNKIDLVEEVRSVNQENHIYMSAMTKKGIEDRSEEHTSELQSRGHLVCRLLLEKKKKHK